VLNLLYVSTTKKTGPDDGCRILRLELARGPGLATRRWRTASHGASEPHAWRNSTGHLEKRGGPCSVIGAPGIIPRVQSETNVRIPDLAVTCSPYEDEESALTDPVLLIEILSPSNQAVTWANVWTYTTIPSVQEILIVKTTPIGGDLLRRNADGLCPSQPLPIENGEVAALDSIGLSFPISAAYWTTRLGGLK
jgi:hypothetical protein